MRGLSPARVAQLVPFFVYSRFPSVLSEADIAANATAATAAAADTASPAESGVHGGGSSSSRSGGAWTYSHEALTAAGVPQSLWWEAGRALPTGPVDEVAELMARHYAQRSGTTAKTAMSSVRDSATAAAGSSDATTDDGTAAATALPSAMRFSARHLPLATRALRAIIVWTLGDGVLSALLGHDVENDPFVYAANLGWRSPMSGLFHSPGIRKEWAAAGASNNWVVNGSFTTTGFPLLCNDPHLSLMVRERESIRCILL